MNIDEIRKELEFWPDQKLYDEVMNPTGAAEGPVSYTHLRAHETRHDLVCRLLLEFQECSLITTSATSTHALIQSQSTQTSSHRLLE